MKQVFEIDGNDFENLDGFFEIFSRVIIPNMFWGRNLDAFDEVLQGEFGTPKGGFILRWKNSELSKVHLGYLETAIRLQERLLKSHPLNRNILLAKIAEAKIGNGPTMFDIIVEIIRDHGVGGNYANDGVELQLC